MPLLFSLQCFLKIFNMSLILSLLLFAIFLLLSSIHFYWAFGGKWGAGAVLPTKSDDIDQKALNPGIVATLIVAFGLLAFGLLPLIITDTIHFELPHWLEKYGLWIIAGIFGLRAIGEFRYVGFFKKYKNTKFGRNDTRYYSPLCLIISLSAIGLILTQQ